MRVLIIGAGIVGYTLAEQLSREKHDIYVIEQNPDIIREMNDNLDVFAVCGSGTSQETLEAIGIQDMDLVVAVTHSDEVNVLSCFMASRYGVARLLARVKNPEFVSEETVLTKEAVGVDMFINATTIVVEIIEHIIEVPRCTDVAIVGKGADMQIRSFALPEGSGMVGQSMGGLRSQLAADAFSIIALVRNGRTFLAEDDVVLRGNDRIMAVLSAASLPLFLPLVNTRMEETRKVVLFGASQAGVHLARRLESRCEQLVLIEKSPERCKAVTEVLKRTLIIQGSALDKGTLVDMGIETVDMFACLSERDEDNVMAAMMAKQYGAKRTLVLMEKPEYVEILQKSPEIDIVINPRLITVSKILQFIRRGKVISAAKMMEGDAEVLEYQIQDDSPIVGQRLGTLTEKGLLPKGSTIACLRDNDIMLIPDKDTVIRSGQSVVMFVLPEALEKAQNLFEGRKWRLA